MFFVYLVCSAGILWALSLSDFLDIYPHFEPWVQVILIHDYDEQHVLKICSVQNNLYGLSSLFPTTLRSSSQSKLSHINTACPHSARLLQTSLLPWIIHWTCILLSWVSFFLFRFFFRRLFTVPHSLSHLSTSVTALLVEPEEDDRSCVLWQWSFSNIWVHCSCKYGCSRGNVLSLSNGGENRN